MTFHILIRGRNCENYISKCLNSLIKQKVTNWKAWVFLDYPTDNSEREAKKIIDPRITIMTHPKNLGLCKNLFFATYYLRDKTDPEDVLAILDADDYLLPNALKLVEKCYKKNKELTYGSYIKKSKGRKTKTSRPYPKNANVATYPWRASHLKTFKCRYLRAIKSKWFRHNDKWLEAASDVALMLPLIKHIGLKHCKHISTPIYLYQDNTPSKTNRKKQIKCEKIIRNKLNPA